MGKSSIGSTCRDGFKTRASAVLLFAVMIFILAVTFNYKVCIQLQLLWWHHQTPQGNMRRVSSPKPQVNIFYSLATLIDIFCSTQLSLLPLWNNFFQPHQQLDYSDCISHLHSHNDTPTTRVSAKLTPQNIQSENVHVVLVNNVSKCVIPHVQAFNPINKWPTGLNSNNRLVCVSVCGGHTWASLSIRCSVSSFTALVVSTGE